MPEDLMYPRPANSDFDFHAALHAMQEDEDLFLQYLADPDTALKPFGLDDEAMSLLRQQDYDGMVTRGIHPILVVQLQRHVEWGMRMSATKPSVANEG